MRACTAVATEISLNTSNDENAKYRAEIEFIQAQDWRGELQILFAELHDPDEKKVYIPIRKWVGTSWCSCLPVPRPLETGPI
jgi:hypothetical protein